MLILPSQVVPVQKLQWPPRGRSGRTPILTDGLSLGTLSVYRFLFKLSVLFVVIQRDSFHNP